MARSYGQIMSAIWNDPDFRRLTAAAQRVYLMLVTQADISSAGTLSLTVGRWSRYASDTTPEGLWHALSELENEAFIGYDRDTEELLVRKFVKWDGGYGNHKRRMAITAAANAVASPTLRGILAVELDTLAVPHELADTLSAHAGYPKVLVTEGEYVPEPETTTLNLEREPRPSTSDDAEPSPFCSKHQPNGTEEPCGPCGTAGRRNKLWHKAKPEREAAARRRAEKARAAALECPDCGGSFWRDDGTKCDHRRAS